MAGLLDTDDYGVYNVRFVYAVMAELIGVLLFALLGGTAPADLAPWANGFGIAVFVYITANISGGHLNPAVTLATLITGHITIAKAIAYVVAQTVGGILGVLLQTALVPGPEIGTGVGALGLFAPGESVAAGQAFGWELIMTFILVSTVYSVAIGTPSFGDVGPLVIGLSVFACATSAGFLTGAGLNPARVLGPAIVYNTGWSSAWYYVIAELIGGALAAVCAWPLYGTGPDYGIWHGIKEENAVREDLADVHTRLLEKREEA